MPVRAGAVCKDEKDGPVMLGKERIRQGSLVQLHEIITWGCCYP